MSKPAKDEAASLARITGAFWNHQGAHRQHPHGDVALAAIRAAGWTVVPVALLEEAASTLESVCDIEYIHRDKYSDEQRRYDRDMEFPKNLRAMLAAAPEVKP